jgi:hypothetical protein
LHVYLNFESLVSGGDRQSKNGAGKFGNSIKITAKKQGRGEGVKGVTVSRGPALKSGPGNHENKRKI